MPLAQLGAVAFCTVLIPILGWGLIACTPQVRYAVGAVLVFVPLLLILGLAYGLPLPGGVDLFFVYPLVAVLLMAAGRQWERRAFSAVVPSPNARAAYIILFLHICGLVCFCVPAMLFAVDSEELHTSPNILLPLPAGLKVVSDSGDDCGIAECWRTMTIGGSAGLSGTGIERRLRDHLAWRGWHLDSQNSDCRKVGWIIDQRRICVVLRPDPGNGDLVIIELQGSEAWA
jgi:hypothetical protein